LLNNDFRDILSEFCAAGVEFVLVGAYAMAAHGLPRATGDIDLWVRCTGENAERVMIALARFGAPLHEIRVEDFHQPGIVFQIGVAPRRVDVLTEIDGVAFEEAWRDRTEIEIDALSVPVLSRAHLLQNKRAAARPKDLADVAWLEAESPEP
jgi:hypothetical protein